MHFYEPGPYDEFVGKLSSITAKPSPLVWQTINAHLDQNLSHNKGFSLKRFAIAASITILIGLSLSLLFINQSIINSEYYTHWENNILISSDSTIRLSMSIAKEDNKPFLIKQNTNHLNSINSAVERTNDSEKNNENSKPLINALAFSSYEFEQNDNESDLTKPFIKETSNNRFKQNFIPADHKKSIEVKEDGTWSLIAYINPSFSYHTAAAFDYSVNPSETGAWMWGGEVLVKKEVSSYFAIYSGIQVSPSGQNISNFSLLQNSSTGKHLEYITANTSFGEVNLYNSIDKSSDVPSLASPKNNVLRSSSFDNAELKQRFYYMEIPLILSTTFKTNHVDIEVKLGCAAGVLIDNKFEVISSEGYFIGKTENIRPHNASAIGAISFSVPINNQFNLIVEPNIRLNLYPLSYSFETTYPFSASVKFGMGYRF